MAQKIEVPVGGELKKFIEQRDEQRDEQRQMKAETDAYNRALVYPETPKSPKVEKKAKGGSIKSSASKRADGIAIRGKTKGRMV